MDKLLNWVCTIWYGKRIYHTAVIPLTSKVVFYGFVLSLFSEKMHTLDLR